MRHVYWLIAVFCLASCHTTAPPPPPSSGVRIDAPFVRIRVAEKPDSTIIVEEPAQKQKGL